MSTLLGGLGNVEWGLGNNEWGLGKWKSVTNNQMCSFYFQGIKSDETNWQTANSTMVKLGGDGYQAKTKYFPVALQNYSEKLTHLRSTTTFIYHSQNLFQPYNMSVH